MNVLKCIKPFIGDAIRVSNEEAEKKAGYGWMYVPKHVWKSQRKKEEIEAGVS